MASLMLFRRSVVRLVLREKRPASSVGRLLPLRLTDCKLGNAAKVAPGRFAVVTP